MGKLNCKYCGGPINGDVCEFCNNKVDSETLTEYRNFLELKSKYNSEIRPKIKNLEKLTEEENALLKSLFENDMIDPGELDFDLILYSALIDKNVLDRNSFELFIKKSTEALMKSFIKDLNPGECTEKIHAFVESMDPTISGEAVKHHYFCFNKNTMERLYCGNLSSLVTVFHELNHGLFDLYIQAGRTDGMLMTMIKERIISGINKEYYEKNYRDNLEEIFAEKIAVERVLDFLSRMNLKAPDEFIKAEENAFSTDYDNRNRVITVDGKDEIKTVDEIFEEVIQLAPDKLKEYPQLNVEYINDNGVIRKKNVDELSISLEGETNPDKVRYIQYLVDESQVSFGM